MGKHKSHDEPDSKSSTVPSSSTALLLVGTFADTTWRMLVPSVGFTLLGVWLDGIWGTKPWLMAIGIVLGFVFAILLVKKQYDRVRKG